ncbi:hypothetical protein CTM46_10980 [Prevotella intermedia]|uniref:Uncharacterized protein n=1 Tax=Prevotella intermedia TaxID=28131 RepID=A0A2D3LN65_PREIN|nr:hypothetical protein CTM46_10980 [Prevotella intermedia]
MFWLLQERLKTLETIRENRLGFVKIIRKKNGNFDLALRKLRFCNAKEPLLPCKSGSFGT